VDIERIYEIQAQLNFAENKLFPLLPMQTNEFNETIERFYKHEKEVQKTKKIIYAKSKMDFIIEPKLKLSLASVKKLNNDTFRKIITNNYKELHWLKQMLTPSENEIYASIEKSIDEYDNKKDTGLIETNVFPKVLFLGTSCSMTNTIRNSTGILVRVNEEKSILLDCGEATIAQMNRFYGNEKLDSELVKIKGLFLSHKHLDHYAGVFGLIRARRKAFENLNLDYERLYVLFPTTLSNYFNDLNKLFKDSIKPYTTLIPNYHITSQGLESEKNAILVNKMNEDLDLESIKSVVVNHVHQSFGIVLFFLFLLHYFL
jgi:ribonuclease Z